MLRASGEWRCGEEERPTGFRRAEIHRTLLAWGDKLMGQRTVASDLNCFTVASFAYLDRARVLGATLREHHSDWILWLCLPDEEPPGFEFDASAEPFDRVVRLHELKIPNLRSWIFEHDLVELCTAVKGPMLCH